MALRGNVKAERFITLHRANDDGDDRGEEAEDEAVDLVPLSCFNLWHKEDDLLGSMQTKMYFCMLQSVTTSEKDPKEMTVPP
eukprot:scaffold31529_cov23-Cyclotella_meneghiniana.AAC.2